VERSKANERQVIAHSHAACERVVDKVYPGTLGLLVGRLAAKSDADARDYRMPVPAPASARKRLSSPSRKSWNETSPIIA